MTLTLNQEEAIYEVKQFIDSMPLTRTPISELMQRSGLSEDILTRGFKLLFNQTLYNYQLTLCMQSAAELLQQKLSIKAVALAAGYKAQGNFTRAFFKIMEVTPSQYQTEVSQQ